MRDPRTLPWREKLYRVIRRNWKNPLDTSFSRNAGDRRWNDQSFEALYCCGSEHVARAVAMDIFRLAGVVPADLQPSAQPALAEIAWSGELVDLYTADGLRSAGLPAEYPSGVSRDETQAAAARWREQGEQGVACRSASLARMGQSEWPQPPARYCEIALWPAAWTRAPRLRRIRSDLRWLL